MFISEEAHSMLDRSEVRSGDLLMTITGNVGRSILLDEDFGTGNINQHIARVRITDSRLDKRFALHFLSQRRVREYYQSITTGQAYPQISLKQVRETEIPLPPRPEQRAIADALSAADALIERLDALIAKKRAIKTATMQRLLTGQQRLPGFSAPWTMKEIGEIAPLQRGFDLPTSNVRPGPFPVVYSNGVLRQHATAMDTGPGVVTGRSGTLGKVHYIDDDYWPHNTTLWVTDFCGNHPKFIYYLYSFIGFERFGGGSGVPTLNRNVVHEHEIPVPTAEEQQAIAGILSDMDAEIKALQARRDKTQAIKQGMMQELLTGRTRLV